MPINVLLIDPDVRFAVGIKRGLEQTGEYRVMVFANSEAALTHMLSEAQDVVVIDNAITDMRLIDLITAIRVVQPALPILFSLPIRDSVPGPLGTALQGTLEKPYIARQLIPRIQAVIASPVPSIPEQLQTSKPIKRIASPTSVEDVSVLETKPDDPATEPPPSLKELPKTVPATDASSVMSAVAGDSSRVMRPVDPMAIFSVTELTARLSRLKIVPPTQAVILTRLGNIVSATGALTDRALQDLTRAIAHVWQPSVNEDMETAPRLRFVQVSDAGEVMVYSVSRSSEWRLTLVFPADIPIRDVRLNARQLIEWLEDRQPPTESASPAESDEPEAATTLPSRPTALRPPPELAAMRESIATDVDAESDETESEDDEASTDSAAQPTAPVPDAPEIPYSPYTLLWQPKSAMLTPELTAQLPDWIESLSMSQGWRVHETTISPGCVSVRIDLPADQMPGTALDMLQQATAERAHHDDLWAEAYYVIASDRAPLPQEIAQFTTYGAPQWSDSTAE